MKGTFYKTNVQAPDGFDSKDKDFVVREDKRCPRGGYPAGSCSLCTGFFPGTRGEG